MGQLPRTNTKKQNRWADDRNGSRGLFISNGSRNMKKAFAAFLIALVCLSVLGAHVWNTWGEVDSVPASSSDDKELFEYSLFLESFVFMLSAAYFVGPRIYRVFKEEEAAIQFEGEKRRVSRTVHTYSAVCVVLRRIALDPQMSVPRSETIVAIALICAPAVWMFIKTRYGARRKEAYPPARAN